MFEDEDKEMFDNFNIITNNDNQDEFKQDKEIFYEE